MGVGAFALPLRASAKAPTPTPTFLQSKKNYLKKELPCPHISFWLQQGRAIVFENTALSAEKTSDGPWAQQVVIHNQFLKNCSRYGPYGPHGALGPESDFWIFGFLDF